MNRVVLLVSIVATLSACAFQPTLGSREIARIHTVKVVYLQPRRDLFIYPYIDNTKNSSTPETDWLEQHEVPHVFAYRKFGGAVPQHYSHPDYTDQYLTPYADEVTALAIRQHLFDGVKQVVERVPWLKGVTIETPAKPTDENFMLDYFRSSNVDAVIYVQPYVWMDDYAENLHTHFNVLVYTRPDNGSRELSDEQEFDVAYKLFVPGADSTGQKYTMYDLTNDARFRQWFAGNAYQLRVDIDTATTQIFTDLAHYLSADSGGVGAKS